MASSRQKYGYPELTAPSFRSEGSAPRDGGRGDGAAERRPTGPDKNTDVIHT